MKEIQLTKGKVALVDDEDFEYLNQWKWACTVSGYAVRCVQHKNKKTSIYMHKLIMKADKSLDVDHIDGNKLNNQKTNLRTCTHAENTRNMTKRIDSKSGYKGVVWQKNRKYWEACIKFNYHKIHIGVFHDVVEAAKAYDKKARELFGEFAKLNFPN